MIANDRKRSILLLAFGLFVGRSAMIVGQESSRGVKIGDVMPPFSLKDAEGKAHPYSPQQKRPLVALFATPGQRQSEQVIAQLQELVSEVARDERPLDLLVIVSDSPPDLASEEGERGSDRPPGSRTPPRLVYDQNWSLWGKLGLVATPTVLLVGRDGVIDWITAGHSHEFRKVARGEIARTLGIPRDEAVAIAPKDAEAAADRDRGLSHLKTGLLLTKKGRAEAAISELKTAETLLPDSPEPLLALAEVFCQIGQSEDALAAVSRVKPTDDVEKARTEQILGWAHRQLGNHAEAEKHLVNSLRLNGNSVRALFELGKLYEKLGDAPQALATYRRALAVQFKEKPNLEEREALKTEDIQSNK